MGKLVIIGTGPFKNVEVVCHYNPETIKMSRTLKWDTAAGSSTAGKSAAELQANPQATAGSGYPQSAQFKSATGFMMKLQLRFDDYRVVDNSDLTAQALTKINQLAFPSEKTKNQPPTVLVYLGAYNFKGVITKLDITILATNENFEASVARVDLAIMEHFGKSGEQKTPIGF